MSILVTGGTGFIGAEIVRRLVADGERDVVVAHRSGNFERIADVLDAVTTVQFETNPVEPYSVNIWVIAMDPYLYVHAGANRAQWVENMEADARVRLQVEDSIYELKAARVAGQDEFDRFSDAYEKKYGRRPRNESVEEAYLFRLAAR